MGSVASARLIEGSRLIYKHWDCLQYLVDNKCPGWEDIRREYAEHLR